MFMSNIKKAGRLALAFDVLLNTVNTIPENKLTEGLSQVLKPSFKTDVLYRTKSQDGDSKLETLLNLCCDEELIIDLSRNHKNPISQLCSAQIIVTRKPCLLRLFRYLSHIILNRLILRLMFSITIRFLESSRLKCFSSSVNGLFLLFL